MLNKIYIVDFDDSFTHNIACVLYTSGVAIEIVNHNDFFKVFLKKYSTLKNTAIILGPGPGHPIQFKKYFQKIKLLLNNPNIYLMGICLGHQLIACQFGYSIVSSENPLHGEKINLFWKGKTHLVQRYNSLAVKAKGIISEISYQNEVMILEYKNGRSFQFHPESVGTENSEYFFKDLLLFEQSS